MEWKKSSRSDSGGQCVEVRQDLAAIRDSKNPGAPAIKVPVTSFVRYAKNR